MIQFLSVIVPCYNEEANLGRYEAELFLVLTPLASKIEFIFVDDGSRDGTLAELEALSRGHSNRLIVRHPRNRGLGAAIRSGIERSQGDALLTLDADLTFMPSEFPILAAAYQPDISAVLGSPFKGRLEGVPFVRRLLSAGVNLIYGILFGQRVTSASSVFRLYRRVDVAALPLKAESFDINAEILFGLLRSGKNVKEVAVTLKTRTGGESKLNTRREVLNHLKMFAKVLAWRFGVRRA